MLEVGDSQGPDVVIARIRGRISPGVLDRATLAIAGRRSSLVDPHEQELTPASQDGITQFLEDWENASRNGGDLWEYLDFESTVDWVLLQEFARNGDAYVLSIHLSKDVDGELKFVPWDFDLTLGNNCSGPQSGWNSTDRAADMIEPIMADPQFRQVFRERWFDLRQTVLASEAIDERMSGYRALLADKIDTNFERWPIDETIGGDDWVLEILEGCPTPTWEEEYAETQRWIHDRLLWVDAYLDES